MKMHSFAAALSLSLALLAPGLVSAAKSAAEIDKAVDTAMADFIAKVPYAKEYLSVSKGVLVVPNAEKFALGVGAEWGEGALRVNDKTAGYYKMNAGSVGASIGYEKTSFLFLFTSADDLAKFQASKGWTADVSGSITVVNDKASVDADSLKDKKGVLAFAIDTKGGMLDWSVAGTKFTKIDKK
jgi:lipid-binding SYLF domain-containing protein